MAGHLAYRNDCIPVFDPEFEPFAFDYARALADTRDDPYLLGVFLDNEMPFFKGEIDKFLQLDENDPGRRAAADWLLARKGALDAPLTEEDRDAWRGHVAAPGADAGRFPAAVRDRESRGPR